MTRHHIRKREGVNGSSWYATVELGRDPASGKRRQKHVSGTTRKECEANIVKVLFAHANGESVFASKITVAGYLDDWLANIRHTVKNATYLNYRDYVRRTIVPHIGAIHLAKLEPLDVQRMITSLLEAGQSPTSVNHSYGVLTTALKKAVKLKIIPANVCRAVDAPKRSTPEMQTWNVEQVAAALVAAKGDDLEALWRLALNTGMRRGELLGLRWQDVDLDRGTLAIRHTLVRGEHNTWESGTPKTAKAQRNIVIGRDDVDALRRHRDRQRMIRHWSPSGLVFLGRTGNALHPNSLRWAFNRFAERAGAPYIRFHDLRHTAATIMLAARENPKVVQERLGHSTLAMTMDRYSHVSESLQRDAVDRVEQFLKRPAIEEEVAEKQTS